MYPNTSWVGQLLNERIHTIIYLLRLLTGMQLIHTFIHSFNQYYLITHYVMCKVILTEDLYAMHKTVIAVNVLNF